VVLRLICYTLDDPNRPGHRQEHRLITSLLDPAQAPFRVKGAQHRGWPQPTKTFRDAILLLN
jgi:hypothetical protein